MTELMVEPTDLLADDPDGSPGLLTVTSGTWGVTRALQELGRTLLTEESLEQVLDKVAHVVLRSVPNAVAVSVTLVQGGRATSAGDAGEAAAALDAHQYAAGYGPCLDAAVAGELVHVTDMREETRWPAYTPFCVEHGVLSSLSIPLPLQQAVLGALNVYGVLPGAFDAPDVELAVMLAGHAAVALANAASYRDAVRLAEQMQDAMRTRAVIEQAKGVVMAQRSCDPETAFSVLREASQNGNRKLRDIAEVIVAAAGGA
ncbi:MAG: ANTAR domain-containing protein [Mycobacteriales bacterium]